VRVALRVVLGVLLGLVAWVWLRTLRVRVQLDDELLAVGGKPWVLSFWHGTQWPLLAWKRRKRTVVLVSLSADGVMQARALAVQGLQVVRGSSSRGGARGLAGIVRAMKRQGVDAAFAVDGPRGPRRVAKEGALLAARASSGVLVPMGAAAPHGLTLTRAWDRFVVAWPFSRVAVKLGAPIDPNAPDALSRLEAAIEQANLEAALLVGSGKLGQAGDGVDLDARAAG
jgi:hypothetical protein